MAKVVYTRRAAKALRRAPREIGSRMRDALVRLAEGDDPPPDVRPLVGRPGWRLRIGSWRAIFRKRDDGTVEVLDVGPRGGIYG